MYRDAPPVAQQPHVHLINWAVFQQPTGARHLIGRIQGTTTWRITTEIMYFYNNILIRTSSGREYILIGKPAEQIVAARMGVILGLIINKNVSDEYDVKKEED